MDSPSARMRVVRIAIHDARDALAASTSERGVKPMLRVRRIEQAMAMAAASVEPGISPEKRAEFAREAHKMGRLAAFAYDLMILGVPCPLAEAAAQAVTQRKDLKRRDRYALMLLRKFMPQMESASSSVNAAGKTLVAPARLDLEKLRSVGSPKVVRMEEHQGRAG